MKAYSVIGLLGAALFAVCAIASEPAEKLTKKERRLQERTEYEKRVVTAVQNKEYTIDVKRVMPSQGRTFTVSPYYSLTIKGDSVYSVLPYFGRAYSVPYGGGEGLRFEGVMRNYKSDIDRKGTMQSEFYVSTREDSYRYAIDVFSNGSALIYVMPNNKRSITFNGDIVFKEEE